MDLIGTNISRPFADQPDQPKEAVAAGGRAIDFLMKCNLGSNSGLGAAASILKSLQAKEKLVGLISDCAQAICLSSTANLVKSSDRGVAVTACIFTGQQGRHQHVTTCMRA